MRALDRTEASPGSMRRKRPGTARKTPGDWLTDESKEDRPGDGPAGDGTDQAAPRLETPL